MTELVMESYGKINLALDVLRKRNDGYHDLNTIMQQIDLKDKLIFRELDQGIKIESNNSRLPLDSTNLVHKAWEKLKSITGINKGIHIIIEKNIPIAAGLAGGSSNGAVTLKALNKLWDLGFTNEQLMEIGKDLGADIPFCILGGTALAQGIGEKLTKLKPFSEKYILLGNPGLEVSTAYAYSKLNLNGKKNINISKLIKFMENNQLQSLGHALENYMEYAIISEHPIINQIKKVMLANGALGALMSGSGPTVFGLFDDEEKIKLAKKNLLELIDNVYICKTI